MRPEYEPAEMSIFELLQEIVDRADELHGQRKFDPRFPGGYDHVCGGPETCPACREQMQEQR